MNENFILALIEKFNTASITELDLNDGTVRLLLRKEAFNGAAGQTVPVSAANIPAQNRTGRVHLGLPVASSGEYITSPIVGTFYPSPSPDAPPFVRPGSKVKTGDTLCILEAMKMMNHLEAEFDCEIIAVKAGGGELVEFGQELFEVNRI
jgi:acetyl-CoA carboxylase biotin carboxyl carrier protein